jgi:hypothetical protein
MKYAVTLAVGVLILAAPLSFAAPPAGNQTPTEELSFKNVTKFFSEALRMRPTEVQKRCVIFYEGEWKNAKVYDYCVIIVENSDQDIQVTFYLTDAREMNWVDEFFEGPFFNRQETEELFRLLHSVKHAQGKQVGRFRVDVNHWEPRHAQIIVLSFTPAQQRHS